MPLRPATPDDAMALSALAGRTFPLACPPTTTPASIAAHVAEHLSPERFADHLADPTKRLAVEEANGALTGYVMVGLDPPPAEIAAQLSLAGLLELSKIYLEPAAQGSGAATALMEWAIELSRRLGAPGLWLGTNSHNHRAQRFYEKSGFRRVGVRTFRVGDGLEDDYVFECVFAPAA